MKYRGEMKTVLLNDRQIRPIEYRKWGDAVRRFEQREKDRVKVEELKESIRRESLREPIILGVSDRYPDVYVADGHHRAVALMTLGADTFPFHWYWIRSFGVRMERAAFPYHLLGL
ncbi:ParB/RepB/Spo0J family partition protein [Rhodococcus sp. NPDC059969]|uniref:ParB/RepB/Spo0J family partition protein n=1 Tax=Rhodococcus sp. NPDC059969 TaxID=3347018 RepID=UPI00366BA732